MSILDEQQADPVEAERPSLTDELRANAGGRRRISGDPDSLSNQLAESARRGGPIPVEPEQPSNDPVVDDEAELRQFLDANADVVAALPFQEPTTDAQVEANARLIREARKAREATAALAAERAGSAVEAAYQAVLDADDPADVSEAFNLAAQAVGLGSDEFGDLARFWSENDPESAGEWLHQTQQMVGWAQQAAQVEQQRQQAAQFQAEVEQRLTEARAAVDTHFEEHPVSEDQAATMFHLAAQIPELATMDAAQLPAAVKLLHETARQADRAAVGSAAWEAAEADKVVNAGVGLRRGNESLAKFRERMAEYGYGVDARGHVVSQANFEAAEDALKTVAAHADVPKVGTPEWETYEAERMAQAWGRPSVRDQDGARARDARGRFLAAQESAARTRQAEREAEEDDPHWSYVMRYR